MARKLLDTIQAGATGRHGDDVWISREGFSVETPLEEEGEGGPPTISFSYKTDGAAEEWISVIVADDCVGPGMVIQDVTTTNKRGKTVARKLMHIQGGPNIVFNQRDRCLEGRWDPNMFEAKGYDPVEVALRMIEAIVAS